MWPRTGWRLKLGVPQSGRSTCAPVHTVSLHQGYATRTDWLGSPVSGALWTVVNERDEIGNDLVPDYLTSVRDGGFYGWPYSYFWTTSRSSGLTSGPGKSCRRYCTRLCPRSAHRIPGAGFIGRHKTFPPVHTGNVHWPARLVEPSTPQWVQGNFPRIRSRKTSRQSN